MSFTASLVIGEELCCHGLFEEESSQTSASQSVDTNQKAEHQEAHFCKGSKKSDRSSHEGEAHHCIGCSHAPFVSLENLSDQQTLLFSETLFFEKQVYISHHFLDGPFQPPRA